MHNSKFLVRHFFLFVCFVLFVFFIFYFFFIGYHYLMLISLDIVAILAEKIECQKFLRNKIFLSEPFADLLEVQKHQLKVILHKY